MTSHEALMAIAAGELDDRLDAIVVAVRDRKDELATQRASTLEIGDKIALQGCKPRYVNGMVGTVLAKGGRRGKILVDVPDLAGTRFKRQCWMAPTALRPVMSPEKVQVD